MLGSSFKIGRLLGFNITISWSFIVIVILFVLSYGFLPGLILIVSLFGSVLIHELGHSLVARSKGVKVDEIELHFFGGVAKLRSIPESPKEEILIAIIGPIVSLALSGIGWIIFVFFPHEYIKYFATLNLILGLFNLLPALPMDGGRVLRGILVKKYGFYKATEISVKVAKIIAIGMGIWALIPPRFNFFLLGIAILVWLMAARELMIIKINQAKEAFSPFFDFMSNKDDFRVENRYYSNNDLNEFLKSSPFFSDRTTRNYSEANENRVKVEVKDGEKSIPAEIVTKPKSNN